MIFISFILSGCYCKRLHYEMLDIKATIILEARLQLFELKRFVFKFSVFTIKFLTAAICG